MDEWTEMGEALFSSLSAGAVFEVLQEATAKGWIYDLENPRGIHWVRLPSRHIFP